MMTLVVRNIYTARVRLLLMMMTLLLTCQTDKTLVTPKHVNHLERINLKETNNHRN